jgi:hypothetical protein
MEVAQSTTNAKIAANVRDGVFLFLQNIVLNTNT